jgi:hypothetical protein
MVGSKTLFGDGSPNNKSITGETKFNPKEITFNELEKFKYHLESIQPSACTELLNQLHTFSCQANMGETNKSMDDIKRRLWKETTSIIKEDNCESRKMDKDQAAYVCIANAQSLNGTIPSWQLKSGFEITLTSRVDSKIGGTTVILRMKERGKDDFLRKKTCNKVVQALKPEISVGNIS